MPSKLKTISVRLPADVAAWVESQDGSAAKFIAEIVQKSFLCWDSPKASGVDYAAWKQAGKLTQEQVDFRRRMLAPKAKANG